MENSIFSQVAILFSVLFAITVHEFTHAKLADAAGDPTPRIYGRVTLNPVAHFDPIGFIFIILVTMTGFGLGWGKPVPMDPRKMKNPRWDHFWAVFGAPLSNLGLAILATILLRLLIITGIALPLEVNLVLFYFIIVNVGLFLFNMLPIGPLDGMWVVSTFLPERLRYEWIRFNQTIGGFLLLGLIFFGRDILFKVMNPIYTFIFRLLGI